MGKGMVIGNRNDGNRYNCNEEWEQGMGTGNGERGTGNGEWEIKKLVLFVTTMTEACDKIHFTLFRRRSKKGSKI